MKFIENYIFDFFDKHDLNYDQELIHYSIIMIVRYITCIVPALIVSLHYNVFCYFLIFLISFYCLRIHFGGIHFKNNYLCAIASISLLVIFPILNNFVFFSKLQIFTIHGILICLFSFLKPQDNDKKRISNASSQYHKKKGMIYLYLYLFLMIFLNTDTSQIILFSVVLEFISMLIAYKKR